MSSGVWYTRLMNRDPEPPSQSQHAATANSFSQNIPQNDHQQQVRLAMLGHGNQLLAQHQYNPNQNQNNQQQGQNQQGGPFQPQQQGGQQLGPQQLPPHVNVNLNQGPIPPPPPLNGQDQTLSGVLHFLQTEWRRYERDRNEWEIERAENRARIALLEGERRSFENVKLDLMRRIKMLEYALRMERSKQLTHPSAPGSHKATDSKSISDKQGGGAGEVNPNKDADGASQKGSMSSSPRSEDIPLPSEQRDSIVSLPPNGIPAPGPPSISISTSNLKKDSMGSSWPVLPNGLIGNNMVAAQASNLSKPLPGRDAKSRARSRELLKQCLQEVNYLTSPPALNPLPNRPILANPTLPLSLPNVPSMEQVGFNGRPRKNLQQQPESGQGRDLPSFMTSGDRDQQQTQQPQQRDKSGPQLQGVGVTGLLGQNQPPSAIPLGSGSGSQLSQLGEVPEPIGSIDPSASTSSSTSTLEDEQPQIEGGWKEPEQPFKLEESVFPPPAHNVNTEERGFRSEGEEEEVRNEDELMASGEAEDDNDSGKVWKSMRTLRNHLDAVRAVTFHPLELCLATGGDDYTVKIWRLDAADLAATSPLKAASSQTETEPQITFRGHTGPITKLVISASAGLLFSASLDATISVWSIPHAGFPTYVAYDASRARDVLEGHTDAVWDLAFVRDEAMLVSCGADGMVKVWNVSEHGKMGALKLSWGYYGLGGSGENEEANEEGERKGDAVIGATALEPLKTDLRKIAVAYQDGAIKLFDFESGFQNGLLLTDVGADGSPPTQANSLASHPTMPLLVSGHEDKYIRIWDIFTGQCTYSMLAHLDAVTTLSIDAAGFSLVSGSHDCSVRFWDLINKRTCTQESQSHREKSREGVLGVEFHPTLPFMASAGADGTVKLYASS